MSELSTTLDEAFNTQTEEGTPDFQPLPAGNYVATIVDAKVGAAQERKGAGCPTAMGSPRRRESGSAYLRSRHRRARERGGHEVRPAQAQGHR